jgi:hypothetical protein
MASHFQKVDKCKAERLWMGVRHLEGFGLDAIQPYPLCTNHSEVTTARSKQKSHSKVAGNNEAF